jgi:hypothetical protein
MTTPRFLSVANSFLDGVGASKCSREYDRTMDVLQCPYCELRFRSESELQQHISFDHPQEKEESESPG